MSGLLEHSILVLSLKSTCRSEVDEQEIREKVEKIRIKVLH